MADEHPALLSDFPEANRQWAHKAASTRRLEEALGRRPFEAEEIN